MKVLFCFLVLVLGSVLYADDPADVQAQIDANFELILRSLQEMEDRDTAVLRNNEDLIAALNAMKALSDTQGDIINSLQANQEERAKVEDRQAEVIRGLVLQNKVLRVSVFVALPVAAGAAFFLGYRLAR
jgi:hypothetical protein